MTFLEFYSITDPSEIYETLQSYIDSFVQNAYKNVPDTEELADRIKAYIRKQGCGYEKLEDIVETVAKQAIGDSILNYCMFYTVL